MKYIKNILVALVMLAFTLNAYAVTSLSLCDCIEMLSSNVVSSDVPCHDMMDMDADMDANKHAQNTMECDTCACDHCKVPTQSMILNHKAAALPTHTQNNLLKAVLYHSAGLQGIEHPPKLLS